MPTRKDIKEIYGGIKDLPALGHLDLYVLDNIVKEHYHPDKSPAVMVVGGRDNEPYVLRKFHQREYGLDAYLAGCNITVSPFDEPDLYDLFIHSDAAMDATWQILRREEDEKFDMAFFRFPDLNDQENWYDCYIRALDNVKQGGTIVTFTTVYDVQKYHSVMEKLRERKGIDYWTFESGISDEYGIEDSIMNTVGIIEVSS